MTLHRRFIRYNSATRNGAITGPFNRRSNRLRRISQFTRRLEKRLDAGWRIDVLANLPHGIVDQRVQIPDLIVKRLRGNDGCVQFDQRHNGTLPFAEASRHWNALLRLRWRTFDRKLICVSLQLLPDLNF